MGETVVGDGLSDVDIRPEIVTALNLPLVVRGGQDDHRRPGKVGV